MKIQQIDCDKKCFQIRTKRRWLIRSKKFVSNSLLECQTLKQEKESFHKRCESSRFSKRILLIIKKSDVRKVFCFRLVLDFLSHCWRLCGQTSESGRVVESTINTPEDLMQTYPLQVKLAIWLLPTWRCAYPKKLTLKLIWSAYRQHSDRTAFF